MDDDYGTSQRGKNSEFFLSLCQHELPLIAKQLNRPGSSIDVHFGIVVYTIYIYKFWFGFSDRRGLTIIGICEIV